VVRQSDPDDQPLAAAPPRRRRRKRSLAAYRPTAALAALLVGGVTICGGVAAVAYLGNSGWQITGDEAAAGNVAVGSSAASPGATEDGGTGETGGGTPPAGGTAPGTGSTASPAAGSTPTPTRGRTGAGGSSAAPSGSASPSGPGSGSPGTASPSASASSPSSSAPSVSASPTPPGASPSSTPTPTLTPTSASPSPTQPPVNADACTDPVFTTSTLYGTYTELPYFVANNMWNVGSASASQTLSACSSSSWNVDATISGGGAGVKTYPNSHLNFDTSPEISTLSSVTSTFADSGPDSGTYEYAYDIWLNGIADPGDGSDELMIWTQNHGQTPGGSPMATVNLDGQSWTAWKGNGGYMAFVANTGASAGSLNLLAFFQWVIAEGWVPADSTLSQIGYGVEIVSTNGVPATFSFSNVSVSAR
jgi:Glycosyl hydrolase family 12